MIVPVELSGVVDAALSVDVFSVSDEATEVNGVD